MAAYWSGGTPPRNTSVSVPRLTPDLRLRTITSSRRGSDRVTVRISPQPGARSQNACASSCTGPTLPDLAASDGSRAAGTGSEERAPEEQLGPGDLRQFLLHCRANRLPRTAHDPFIYGREVAHNSGPELRHPPRRIGGKLEIKYDPASTSDEGRSAMFDDLCAVGHLRQSVCGQDRVDIGWEVERNRVGLHETD